jgi:hypothetical protein
MDTLETVNNANLSPETDALLEELHREVERDHRLNRRMGIELSIAGSLYILATSFRFWTIGKPHAVQIAGLTARRRVWSVAA